MYGFFYYVVNDLDKIKAYGFTAPTFGAKSKRCDLTKIQRYGGVL